jgi:hypothetical protein
MKFFILTLLLSLNACHKNRQIKNLPQAITNNAVTLVDTQNGLELYSFNGLSSGKTWKDIRNVGFVYKNNHWSEISMPESSKPVLASTAVSIGSIIYMIGGYTVDAHMEEKSVASIYALNTQTQEWRLVTNMPIAVDDTVALVYANRYIYLISGWHDTDNVSAIQVYDSQDNKWFNATDYPAPAVFGQAGGIVGNQMIICDGVKVVVKEKGRDFIASPVCLKGVIDVDAPQNIHWSEIPHHSQTAYYRMAATGDKVHNRIVFAGGSDNPYNYNGVGYDGVPSEASNHVFIYDFNESIWKKNTINIQATMDHRSMLTDGFNFYIVGGMNSQQQVLSHVQKFKIEVK